MNLKPLWLFNQDSNLDKQDQNLLCYHYTIEQSLSQHPAATDYVRKDTAVFYSRK